MTPYRGLVAFVVVLALLAGTCVSVELLNYDPVASPAAVVVSGHARFTVLTPRVIRMEWDPRAAFEDRATLAVVNRRLDVPSFQQSVSNGQLSIVTDSVRLMYTVGQGFNASTLTAELVSAPGQPYWHWGKRNDGNLLGTIRSLDEEGVISLNCTQVANVKVHNESLYCAWGLVSRDGWAVLPDHGNQVLSKSYWWDGPNADTFDAYLFAHGSDYVGALADYIQIGGRIAMVPRYMMGIMYSRWFNYNNVEVTKLVNAYEDHSLPLDVHILDMNWHTKQAWGGYTFDRRLYPSATGMMSWLKSLGLATAVNLHDDNGVMPTEVMYKAFCEALGYDPATKGTVPLDLITEGNATHPGYMHALEDIVLNDPEGTAMIDNWWIDWQQGGEQGGVSGVGSYNPTIWLNKIRATDHLRRNEPIRGAVIARWGGMGNHRYQVGFSGDVNGLTWANLAFQPYFSWTASNVGFGFWSHDLVGPANDHELHVRWIQWGAFSGAFRTHDRGMSAGGCADDVPDSCAVVRVWELPTPFFDPCRDVMQWRASLMPHIYTAVRAAYDTGVSVVRPMYYYEGSHDQAYAGDASGAFAQYFFGSSDLIVAPIVTPADPDTHVASKTVWLPPGQWYDLVTGHLRTGGPDTLLTKGYALSQVPMFARAGSMLIQRPNIGPGHTMSTAMEAYDELQVTIFPGADSGSYRVYEDDGWSTTYVSGQYAWTTVSYSRVDASTIRVTIGASEGSFASQPTHRTWSIHVAHFAPLASATVDGSPVTASAYGGANTWRFDGPSVSAVVQTGALSVSTAHVIELKAVVDPTTLPLNGLQGMLDNANLAKAVLDADRTTPGAHSPVGGNISVAASQSLAWSWTAGTSPSAVVSAVQGFAQLWNWAVTEVKDLYPNPPPPSHALVQLYDEGRLDALLCGTTACVDGNSQYETLWIEGYQAPAPGPNTVALKDFFNGAITDNWATTYNVSTDGYSPATFGDGLVYATQEEGTVPLRVFWSDARQDMLSAASDLGIAFARQYGYKEVNATVGYVLSKDPNASNPTSSSVPYPRWSECMALLEAAVV